jgi:nicotinamidase-related amidase
MNQNDQEFAKDSNELKPWKISDYNTVLERHLHSLDVNTVVVCGCNFPNCPRTTIYEASERDFRIVLAKDATSVMYDIALQEVHDIIRNVKGVIVPAMKRRRKMGAKGERNEKVQTVP